MLVRYSFRGCRAQWSHQRGSVQVSRVTVSRRDMHIDSRGKVPLAADLAGD
jgi:hypothetical protein